MSLTTQAIITKKIEDLDVSTAIIVNGGFVQSSKQILLSLRELQLSKEEIVQLETIQEISDLLIEDE